MDLAADSRRIDLWCTYIAEIGDASLFGRYEALLSIEERAAQRRFVFARDQRRYLVTRALVRTVLSRYARVRPEAWVFSAGPHGRPAISAPLHAPALEFNISHSGDLVMLGVTSGRTLGIDTESIAGRAADIDGLDRYFAPEESAALLALPAEQRRRRFFELAGGRGLTLHMRPQLGDEPERWRLWQMAPRCGYLAAVCAARGEDSPLITVREIVPLAGEKPVSIAATRSTG